MEKLQPEKFSDLLGKSKIVYNKDKNNNIIIQLVELKSPILTGIKLAFGFALFSFIIFMILLVFGVSLI